MLISTDGLERLEELCWNVFNYGIAVEREPQTFERGRHQFIKWGVSADATEIMNSGKLLAYMDELDRAGSLADFLNRQQIEIDDGIKPGAYKRAITQLGKYFTDIEAYETEAELVIAKL